ncbi:MAG: M15 family metallopeptidase, partial [Desulfobulbales bacterium]|nr:M15 family metallopeptidase [Desulfobulbales bacterium]
MRRRDFLKTMAAGVVLSGIDPFSLASASQLLSRSQHLSPSGFDGHIKDYLHKMRNFDKPHTGDIYLEKEMLPVLRSCVQRLRQLQRTVGHGNFHLLSFDDGLAIARNYPKVGRFPRTELDFLERIFYTDSHLYGFRGEKPIDNMTTTIRKRDVVKIPKSGNYLYKGAPHAMYEKVKRQIGDKLYLTSGIRGVIKQFMLFLQKADKHEGNLSLASRSLAPPGYSFHGIADFDVGQIGYGSLNFTASFTNTEVFRKLDTLDYITIRYPKDNLK